MSTAAAATYTPDDLLTMPDGDRYELVEGQLLEKPMGAKADWVAMQLIYRLISYLREFGLGEVFGPETGYRCFSGDQNKVRKPDGSVIVAERLPQREIPDGHIRIAPDLAFEVISPHDTYYEVEAKVHEYLDAGVRLVWVLNPDIRTIRVFDPASDNPQDLSIGDDLVGDPVLPGFRCAVEELFPRGTLP